MPLEVLCWIDVVWAVAHTVQQKVEKLQDAGADFWLTSDPNGRIVCRLPLAASIGDADITRVNQFLKMHDAELRSLISKPRPAPSSEPDILCVGPPSDGSR